MVIDGTGLPPSPLDVIISGDRITEVVARSEWRSSLASYANYDVIECPGLIIAPGFIDAHSHSDLQVLDEHPEKTLQGVTAEVVGNCGFSAYPLPETPVMLRDFANGIFSGDDQWGWHSAADYLNCARRSRIATVVSLVGHGSLRIAAAGNNCRALSTRELDRMTGILNESLQQGAVGLSTGLMYAPGSAATSEELRTLCRVVAKRGGIHSTHMRSYTSRLIEAVDEQIDIAERCECRLQISHLQAVGRENWPLQERAIAHIEQAAAHGVDVMFDAYPWLFGSTVLTQLLPQAALDGGINSLMGRLSDPTARAAIARDLELEHGDRWGELFIAHARHNPHQLEGRSLWGIATERGDEPSNTVLDILLEQEGDATILENNQCDGNLRQLLTHPLAMIVSDGLYTRGRPHPRLYGTFPHLLGNIVRERGWLSLEEAVRKISGIPAARFDLHDRGIVSPGFAADLAVFNPKTVDSGATYEHPTLPPRGISAVFRKGFAIVTDGKLTAELSTRH